MRALVAAALLLAAACGPRPAAEPPAEPPVGPPAEPAGSMLPEGAWLLPGSEWRLVELGGAPFAARATATLTADGRVVGQAPCNRFSATWSGRWPDLAFSAATATEMACPELDAERAFFAALDRVDRAALGENGLTLSGPDGVTMRFERIA